MTDSPSKILIIAVPGIGDALLATPLIRSIKLNWPGCSIDVLVRPGREDILASNPDISSVLSFPSRPTFRESFDLLKNLFRNYDLAVSTSPSDRSFIITLLAGRKRINLIHRRQFKNLWKYLLADQTVELDTSQHTVIQNLKIAELLGIAKSFEVVSGNGPGNPEGRAELKKRHGLKERYAVVHCSAGSGYKEIPLPYWLEIVKHLISRGFQVALTGGNSDYEKNFCELLASECSGEVLNLCGMLNFADIYELICGAMFYVGNDTSTTHLAASTGKLTFALFGPSSARKWAPWPRGYQSSISPFQETPGVQKVGNVVVLKANCRCHSFNRHCRLTADKKSACLNELHPGELIKLIEKFMPEGDMQSASAICDI